MAIERGWGCYHPACGSRSQGNAALLELKVLMGPSTWAGSPDQAQELGQLEARVHADGVAQLLPQDALLAVVGQLEQVEAGGGGGQTAAWLPLADGEEPPEDTAQGVPSVLQAHPTASGWEVPGMGDGASADMGSLWVLSRLRCAVLAQRGLRLHTPVPKASPQTDHNWP